MSFEAVFLDRDGVICHATLPTMVGESRRAGYLFGVLSSDAGAARGSEKGGGPSPRPATRPTTEEGKSRAARTRQQSGGRSERKKDT